MKEDGKFLMSIDIPEQENKRIEPNVYQPILLVSFAFGIIFFLLPIFGKRIGASALEIGMLFSVFSMTTLFVRPFMGYALDRFGRRRFFLSSLILYVISLMLFTISPNINLLYLARIFQGLASSLMWISAYTIVADSVPGEERGRAFGRVDESYSRGSFYGSFLGFFILGQFTFFTGWRIMFAIFSVIAMIGLWTAWKNVPETLLHSKTNEQKNERFSIDLIKIMMIVFISAIASSMITPLVFIYLQDKVTEDIGAIALTFIPAAIIYSYFPSKTGRLSDRMGRIKLISLGLFISGVVSFLIPNISKLLIFIVLWVIEAIGIILSSPALEAYVADITGKNTRGRSYGYYLFASSLGAVFGPIIGGWLYDNMNISIPFYINGIILMVNSVLVLFLLREHDVKQPNVVNYPTE